MNVQEYCIAYIYIYRSWYCKFCYVIFLCDVAALMDLLYKSYVSPRAGTIVILSCSKYKEKETRKIYCKYQLAL